MGSITEYSSGMFEVVMLLIALGVLRHSEVMLDATSTTAVYVVAIIIDDAAAIQVVLVPSGTYTC